MAKKKKGPTVFVVMRGERSEGGSVVSVKTTRAKARTAAHVVMAARHSEDPWEEVAPDSWEQGCDQVWIQAMRLE